MDPLAEKYPSWSPYNYVTNNPCNKFDPDGKEPCCDYVSQNNGAYREIRTAPAQPSRFYLENKNNNLVNYGIMNVAAMVYVEMTQGTFEDKQVVAEVIRNRVVVSNEFAREHSGKMEYGATTFSVLHARGSTGQAHFEALDNSATKKNMMMREQVFLLIHKRRPLS